MIPAKKEFTNNEYYAFEHNSRVMGASMLLQLCKDLISNDPEIKKSAFADFGINEEGEIVKTNKTFENYLKIIFGYECYKAYKDLRKNICKCIKAKNLTKFIRNCVELTITK